MNEKWLIERSIPWIIGDVDEKVEIALGPGQLSSLDIAGLVCESWVANEFLDLMCGYDLPEQGIEKLVLSFFRDKCLPFEDEVITRVASICPHLTHL